VASLFTRSNGVYYIAYIDGDRRRWRSTGTRCYEEAREFLAENESQFKSPRMLRLDDFSKHICSYAEVNFSSGTCYLYQISLRDLRAVIGNKRVTLISVADVERYKAESVKRLSRVTINIRFRTLRAAFAVGVKLGYLTRNVFLQCKQFRLPQMESPHLTRIDLIRLLSSIEDRGFRELVIVATETMMRIGELVNLAWHDVNFDTGVIHVRNKETFRVKGLKPRDIPMTNDVFHILASKQRNSEFVFCNKKGGQLLTRSVSRKFKKYVRKSGLPLSIHLHSLRHSGASLFAQEGAPEVYVQRVLGHSSPVVTQLYSHVAAQGLIQAVRSLRLRLLR
jgi:integrase